MVVVLIIEGLRRRYRHVMGQLIDDVQLLDGQLVDLVQNIDAGYVSPIALDDVDELVDGGIASAENITAHYFVLPANGVDDLVGQDGLLHHRLKVNGTFVFTPVFRKVEKFNNEQIFILYHEQ